jgi:hypothetical protein
MGIDRGPGPPHLLLSSLPCKLNGGAGNRVTVCLSRGFRVGESGVGAERVGGGGLQAPQPSLAAGGGGPGWGGNMAGT